MTRQPYDGSTLPAALCNLCPAIACTSLRTCPHSRSWTSSVFAKRDEWKETDSVQTGQSPWKSATRPTRCTQIWCRQTSQPTFTRRILWTHRRKLRLLLLKARHPLQPKPQRVQVRCGVLGVLSALKRSTRSRGRRHGRRSQATCRVRWSCKAPRVASGNK